MSHIMIDLETMGTDPDAMILSIGAAKFDASGVTDQFEVRVDPSSYDSEIATPDFPTLCWWLRQSDASREVFRESDEMHHLCDALLLYTMWQGDRSTVWGNGSDFDNAILANAFRLIDLPLPWGPFSNRCYRTLKNCCPDIEIERLGTHHSAVDDAKSQAIHLVRCADHLGITDVLFSTTKKEEKN